MNHTHFVEDYAFGLLPDKNVTDRLYGTIADPNKSSNLTKFCLANASFRWIPSKHGNFVFEKMVVLSSESKTIKL